MNPLATFRKSINIQILTISAIAIALTGAMVGLLSFRLAKVVYEKKIFKEDLKTLIELKKVKIENEIEKALKVSQLLASDPELIEWFQGRESNSTLKKSTESKMINIAKLLEYTRIFASNVSTNSYYYFENHLNNKKNISIERKIINNSSKEDEWFFKFWNSNQIYEVNISKSKSEAREDSENTYAYINTLIQDGNKKIGVAGVGVKLTLFVKRFFEKDSNNGKTLLVDTKTMTVKISSDFSEIDKQVQNFISEHLNSEQSLDESNNPPIISNDEKGDSVFLIFRHFSINKSLAVVYVVPYEQVMSEFSIIRHATIASTVIIVLFAFVIFSFYSRKITRPILDLAVIAERISGGELELRYITKTRNEIGRLAASFNAMTESLAEKNKSLEDYSKNLQEKVYEHTYELAKQKRELELKNRSMQKELEMGQKVQGIFLLPFNSRTDWYEIYATSYSSKELGGDFFRIYETGKNEVWMIIGDVSGKGVGSSLIMTASVSLLDQIQGICKSIDDLARDFNSQLYHLIGSNKGTAPGFFVTAGCAFLSKEENRYFIYTVNAGHEPPLLFRNDKFSVLPSGGRAFGIREDTNYNLFKTELFKGDILFYVTDGMFEQRNQNGDFFEFENIKKSIGKYKNESVEIICNKLIEDLDDFSVNVPQEDDRTIVAFRIL
ncbi:MAG TPA: SpoIIE family protein phosphatase [Leptospiraceae bacterium]|nr:SpoIIE family protein phosphatase [Leptospiraceae bacterium]HNA08621.1 SpoIIE family protein phosphatase [Leptospiraceae bacterium]HNH01296.1 SpoIIE family protein phosphatase [Leptospiraceae bacterium]